ncbi:hypothetical protein DSECCO2_477720 [anaerobic digester metagenome]
MLARAPAIPPILVERAWFSSKSQLVMVMVFPGISTSPSSPPNPTFSMAPAAPPISSAWARLPVKVVSVRVMSPPMLARAPATPPISSVTLARLLVKVLPVMEKVDVSPRAMLAMAPAIPPMVVAKAWLESKSQFWITRLVSTFSRVSMNSIPPNWISSVKSPSSKVKSSPTFSMAPATPPISVASAAFA